MQATRAIGLRVSFARRPRYYDPVELALQARADFIQQLGKSVLIPRGVCGVDREAGPDRKNAFHTAVAVKLDGTGTIGEMRILDQGKQHKTLEQLTKVGPAAAAPLRDKLALPQ